MKHNLCYENGRIQNGNSLLPLLRMPDAIAAKYVKGRHVNCKSLFHLKAHTEFGLH